ncbi:hypothetical protein TrLO_g10751 [Triparma laevis f. longispina]|uniref:Uncharacterized protein n=1 Tax=Triparma laevis f. longispina TaxID=1714387 RepID=A0A9W7DWW1_9STRA|nr:hypothetical protein TrLO_g10751 [Triparma laevis f. longispina]
MGLSLPRNNTRPLPCPALTLHEVKYLLQQYLKVGKTVDEADLMFVNTVFTGFFSFAESFLKKNENLVAMKEYKKMKGRVDDDKLKRRRGSMSAREMFVKFINNC